MLCHNFISFFCTDMCKPFLTTYLHVLLITKIILLKWLPSAIMPKSVSKVGDWWTFFGLFTVCIWVSWRYSTWHHDNWVKNQGTNAIIIALILLSLDPIVKSGLHSQGYNNRWHCFEMFSIFLYLVYEQRMFNINDNFTALCFLQSGMAKK